jgi:hypothetical protein
MYQKVRDVYYRTGTRRRGLPLIARERLEDYSITGGPSEPSGFYLEGNSIVLLPDIGSSFSGQLEISFYFRPGELVLSTECRKVDTVDLSTKTITFADDFPTEWVVGTKLDIHSGSSGAEIHGWDLTIATTPTTDSITITDAIDGSTQGTLPVEVGDYVCLAETAALPGLPREMQSLLAQAVNVMLMEGDDPESFAISKDQLEKKILRMLKVINERVDSQTDVIVNRNSLVWAGHGSWPFIHG